MFLSAQRFCPQGDDHILRSGVLSAEAQTALITTYSHNHIQSAIKVQNRARRPMSELCEGLGMNSC